MNSFLNYYQSEIKKYGGLDKYVNSKSIEKKPLLDRIRKYAKNRKILEAGCGSAVNSLFLAKNNFDVTGLDRDKEMLKLAEDNAKFLNCKIKLIEGDIKDLSENKFDVVFNHGVLEHYSDTDIIKLINAELSVGEYAVISIPSNFFKQEQAILGDERFMSKSKWKNIISKSQGKLIEEFSYFYDSDELKIRFMKKVSLMTFNLLPFKKPYLGFVVGRK